MESEESRAEIANRKYHEVPLEELVVPIELTPQSLLLELLASIRPDWNANGARYWAMRKLKELDDGL